MSYGLTSLPDSVLLLLRCHHQASEASGLPVFLHVRPEPASVGLLVAKQPLVRAASGGSARGDVWHHVGGGGQPRQRHLPRRVVRLRAGSGRRHELRDRWVHLPSVVLCLLPGISALVLSTLPVHSLAFFPKPLPIFLKGWLWLTPVTLLDAGSSVECPQNRNRLKKQKRT